MFGGPVRIKRFSANDVEIVCICMPISFIIMI